MLSDRAHIWRPIQYTTPLDVFFQFIMWILLRKICLSLSILSSKKSWREKIESTLTVDYFRRFMGAAMSVWIH